MKKYHFIVLFLIFLGELDAQPTISLESFATGLDKPVNIKHAGDARLFVVEQEGFIRIVNTDGSLITTPFLDIESQVGGSGTIGDERGFLGLAFHPNFATNGFFYVNYTNTSGNTVVSRFTVSGSNANLANTNSEQIILTINQPAGNHNGGDMAFGSDGMLYISSGDGGGSGDPTDKGQDLSSLLGKILRIDVDNASGGNNYAIPSNNPFISDPAALDEIWAYGVRNPWKFSFDRQTNDIWIADVGQGGFEEINMMPSTMAGLNYGWRCYEGNNPFNTGGCANMNTMTFPIATLAHSSTSFCSITGGYRYRGAQYPGFQGLYFFADYCSNEIGTLTENGSTWNLSLTPPFNGNGWVAFGEDVNGELYIAGINSSTIYKIKDATLSTDNTLFSNFKMFPNPAKTVLNLVFTNRTTPETITLYDVQGRAVKKVKDFSSNTIEISTEQLNKGLYFVQILGANGEKATKKLVLN